MTRRPRPSALRRPGARGPKPRRGTAANPERAPFDGDRLFQERETEARRPDRAERPRDPDGGTVRRKPGPAIIDFDPKNVGKLYDEKGQWQGPIFSPEKIEGRPNPFPPMFDFVKPVHPVFPAPGTSFQEVAARFEQISVDVPLMLLPVRLETRFRTAADGKPQLHIRVMPGNIFLSPRERQITPAEREAAEAFLKLVDEHGPEHANVLAEWTARVGRPDGLRFARAYQVVRGTLSGAEVDPDKLDTALVSELLPDRWLAVGYSGRLVAFEAFSRPVNKTLEFTPDPTDPEALSDPESNLKTRWMFDFQQAWQDGMAIKANLTPDTHDDVTELFVLGWKDTQGGGSPKEGAAKAAALLSEVLTEQHYAFGGGFVPQGVSTNNTRTGRSGWSAVGGDVAAAWQREREAEDDDITSVAHASDDPRPLWPGPGLSNTTPESNNAGRMQAALGLPDLGPLRRLQFREGSEGAAMRAMNTLLWPTTFGELLGTLLDQPTQDDFFDSDLVTWVRDWFHDHVSGGGVLPALRLDDRPYGVLPVQRHTLRQFGMSLANAAEHPHRQLEIFLETLMAHWLAAERDIVKLQAEDRDDGQFQTPGERLLHVLQQSPHPQWFTTSPLESAEESVRAFIDGNRHELTHPDSDLVGRAMTLDLGGEVEVNIVRESPEFFDWPRKFRSAQHMETHLAGVQAILASILSGQRLYPFDDAWGEFFADLLADQNGDAIEEMVNLYDAVLEVIAEQKSRNFILELLGAPTSLANSVPAGRVDPPFSYLVHGVEEKEWPREHLVEVDKGEETVSVLTWMQHLRDYAAALIDGEPAGPEPEFPDGQSPLLYRLIRTGLRRTATAKTAETSVFGMLIEEMTIHGQVTQATAESLSQAQLQTVTDTLELVLQNDGNGSSSGNGYLSPAPAELTQLLFATPVAEITAVASSLHALSQDSSQPQDFPFVQAGQISQALQAFVDESPRLFRELKPATPGKTRTNELEQMSDALGLLRNLTKDQLELLLTQTLGIVSWRLDAWITSLANWRLTEMRKSAPGGIQIGAYGYVHDLTRAKEGQSGRSQGFIPAPSIAHAKAAAVLRAGWTAYGSEQQDSPFAVDLSSARVRRGRQVMDAVRQGRDLAVVLGHQFETDLRRSDEGAVWILPVRRVMPELSPDGGSDRNPADIVRQSVDGLDLSYLTATDHARDVFMAKAEDILTDLLPASVPFDPDWRDALLEALDGLADTVDALADLGVSEAVHQLIQGNVERAGGALRALQTGDAPPPELEVLQTGTAARSQQHQLILPLDTDGAAALADSLLSKATPEVSGFLDRLFEDLASLKIGWRATDADGALIAQGYLSWQEDLAAAFGLGAIDLMRIGATSGLASGLAPWVAVHLAGTLEKEMTPATQVSLTLDMPLEIATPESLDAVLDAWRTCLANARSFDARDIPPSLADAEGPLIDLDAMEERAVDLREALEEARTALEGALDGKAADPQGLPDDMDPLDKSVEPALLALAQAGLGDALTVLRHNRAGGTGLGAALRGLIPRMTTLVGKIAAYAIDTDAVPELRLKAASDAIRSVLGRGVPLVCPIAWDAVGEYRKGFRASETRVSKSPGALEMWIERQGYTHEALGDAQQMLELSEATGLAPAALSVCQWPDNGEAEWIGIAPATERDGPNRSALTLRFATGQDRDEEPDLDRPLTALILADVIETIPASATDMAAALHFDSPNAEAPQAILLAVPKEGDAKWDFNKVLHTVRSAVDLAKIRLADGNSISQFNQILPAIYGAAGLHQDNDFDV